MNQHELCIVFTVSAKISEINCGINLANTISKSLYRIINRTILQAR